MATWDTYDLDKACEDASWSWITIGSPNVTPTQNLKNSGSLFNTLYGQSCYNAFRKGGIDFTKNWVDCTVRRYTAKLVAHVQANGPQAVTSGAFPTSWWYKIYVEARMWISINQAQKDMAVEGPTTPDKIALATQTRLITALPGSSTGPGRAPAPTPTLTQLLRTAAAPSLTQLTRTATPTTAPTLLQRLRTSASTARPIIVAPVPIPGVPSEPSPDVVTYPMDVQPQVSVSDLPSSIGAAREARTFEGVTYYALPEPAASAVLSFLVGMESELGSTVVEEKSVSDGTIYVRIKLGGAEKKAASTVQLATQHGLAIIVGDGPEATAEIWMTRDVVAASDITSHNLESAVVQAPSSGWQKPGELVIDGGMKEVAEVIGEKAKTGLLIGGVVVGVIALGGIAYYYSTRKPAPMRANKRRPRKPASRRY
jgi:hypothetical protein